MSRCQRRPKAQLITAHIRACPLPLTYDANVRREGAAALLQQALWLVEVQLVGVRDGPWLLTAWWVWRARFRDCVPINRLLAAYDL
jgi:hypothetical protein